MANFTRRQALLHFLWCVLFLQLRFHEIRTWGSLAPCPGPWAVSLTNWDADITCAASNTLASKKVWNSQVEFERNQRFIDGPHEWERNEPSLCWLCSLGLYSRFGKRTIWLTKEIVPRKCAKHSATMQCCNNSCTGDIKLTYQICLACFVSCRKILHHHRCLENNGKQWMNRFDFMF